MLTETEGIPEREQNLFFSGSCLNHDNQKLTDCGIQENSLVTVHDFVPLKLSVVIKPLKSRQQTITIDANPNDTIEYVKSCIVSEHRTDHEHSGSFGLFYAGKQVAEDRTLESLQIHDGSTLHMVNTPKDAVALSVKMPSGQVLRIEVKLLHSVGDVKTAVESVAGHRVKNLDLVYNGVNLDESKKLCSYDVTEGSVLEMVPRIVQIFVRGDRTFAYDVCLEDSVMDLKRKISDRQGIPVVHIRLVFDGRNLDDSWTLASCNIRKDHNVQMMFRWPIVNRRSV